MSANWRCDLCENTAEAFKVPDPLDSVGVALMKEHLWQEHQVRPGIPPKPKKPRELADGC